MSQKIKREEQKKIAFMFFAFVFIDRKKDTKQQQHKKLINFGKFDFYKKIYK